MEMTWEEYIRRAKIADEKLKEIIKKINGDEEEED